MQKANVENLKTGRYCVFASYNKDGIISDAVLFYLKELNKITDGIVLIADNNVNSDEIKKIENLTIYSEFKPHGEYDFGSYKRGFLYLKENGFLENANEIIFANDSCYGPLRPFKDFISKWEKENKPDFYGMTINNGGVDCIGDFYFDTIDQCSHVQSYFFLVTKNIFEKDFFINFMKNIKHFDNKWQIVINYEIGLSKIMEENGFTPKAIFNFNDSENPTLRGKNVYKTLKYGFLVKKVIHQFINPEIVNCYLLNSIFPYLLKDDKLIKKNYLQGILKIFCFYLKQFLKFIFEIKNKNAKKIITVLGIKFKFDRYAYKISSEKNKIAFYDNKDHSSQVKGKKIEGLEIKIKGEDNRIRIFENTEFENSHIEINSNNNQIITGKNTKLKNAKIIVNGNNTVVYIKSNNTIENKTIVFDKENERAVLPASQG